MQASNNIACIDLTTTQALTQNILLQSVLQTLFIHLF